MRKAANLAVVMFAYVMSAGLSGCNQPVDTTGAPSDTTVTTPPPGGDEHAGHDHPSEGPHHGSLVELGNEEYHAEVVHGEDESVTVYILDSAATGAVAIDAAEVTINVTHDGQPEQFKLAASADGTDPQGKSSRFTSTDPELGTHLDEEGATAKLTVMINGKSYSGEVSHSHDGEHKH